jgi:hypothetical protein
MFAIGVMGLLAVYLFVKFIRSKDKRYLAKTICVVAAIIIAGIFELAYLYANILYNGYATGVERVPAFESVFVLSAKLFVRLAQDYANSFSAFVSLPIGALILFAIAIYCFISLKRGILKEDIIKNNDWTCAIAFIGVGILYTCAIAAMRFRAQFDDFGSRLLFPGTFCVLIGCIDIALKLHYHKIAGFLSKPMAKYAISSALAFTMLLSPMIQLRRGASNIGENEPYLSVKNKITEQYSEIAPKSLIIFNAEARVTFIRPDVSALGYNKYYHNIIPTTKQTFDEYVDERRKLYEHIYIYSGESCESFIENIDDAALIDYLQKFMGTPETFVEI